MSGIFEKFKIFQLFLHVVCGRGGVYIFESFFIFFCFLMSTMRFFFIFYCSRSFPEFFKKFQFFACRVWRGGVTFLTVFYRFLFSDVNDAVFFPF